MTTPALALRNLHKSYGDVHAVTAPDLLRGAGLDVVGPELAIMLAWGVICFVLALRLFRWR